MSETIKSPPWTHEYAVDCPLGQGAVNYTAAGHLHRELMLAFIGAEKVVEYAFARSFLFIRSRREMSEEELAPIHAAVARFNRHALDDAEADDTADSGAAWSAIARALWSVLAEIEAAPAGGSDQPDLQRYRDEVRKLAARRLDLLAPEDAAQS